MALRPKQREQLKNALLDAFPSQANLELMVNLGLDQNLEVIVIGENLSEVTLKLIQWAESQNKVGDLVTAACEENPGNVSLKTFAGNFPQLLLTTTDPLPDLPCPYLGLSTFQEKHEAYFFGREAFVEQLGQKVCQRSAVVILGASGSGKSSVVFAGLVPKLRRQNQWVIASLRPGSEPFKSLAGSLVPLYEPELTKTDLMAEFPKAAQYLQERTISLADMVATILQTQRARPELSEANRFLLVIDQFEELYTLCKDEATQRSFVDLLLDAIQEPKPIPLHLVLTLRADFMGRALEYRLFDDERKEADIKLQPMKPAELEQVVTHPAESLDIFFEPGLVERILGEVGQEIGQLPLLEFALRELWERRAGKGLSHAAYQAIGGVKGALTQYAEKIYAEFNPAQQAQIQRIFVQLVNPGQGVEDTRRVVARPELVDADWPLVKSLADHRLVVTDKNENGEEIVEIVHEALIRNWTRLRAWVNKDREFRLWQDQLRVKQKQWQDNKRHESELLGGRFLEQSKGWLHDRGRDLSEAYREYIQASLAHQQRKNTGRRILGIALVALISAMLVFGFSWQNADSARQRAEIAEQEANSLRLAITSNNQTEVNHELALLLAIEAAKQLNLKPRNGVSSVPLGVTNSLRQAFLHRGQTIALLTPHTEKLRLILASPSGTYFLTAGLHEIIVWDAVTKVILNNIPIQKNIRQIAWSPDSQRLAVATDGEAGTTQIWNVAEPEPAILINTEDMTKDMANSLAWNAVGDRLAIAGQNKKVSVWKIGPHSADLAFTLEHRAAVTEISWNTNNSEILTISDLKTHVWHLSGDAGIQTVVLENNGREVKNAEANFDGTKILTIDNRIGGSRQNNNVYIWDSQTGKKLKALSHPDKINKAVWSDDGQHVLTAGSDGLIRLWNVDRAELKTIFTGHRAAVYDLQWSMDEQQILSASQDHTIIIWQAGSGQQLGKLTGHSDSVNGAIWNKNGTEIFSISDDATVRIWNPSPGTEVATLIGHQGSVSYVAWSPDGTKITTASSDKTARIWDAVTGEPLYVLSPHGGPVNQAMWSPDGKFIVTVANEGVVRFWNSANGELIQTIKGHEVFVKHAAWFEEHGQLFLVTASTDHTAKVWTFSSSNDFVEKQVLEMEGEVNQAVWHPVSAKIATIAFSRGGDQIQIWDALSGTSLQSFKGHKADISSIDWNADGSKLATSSYNGEVIVWDVTGKLKPSTFIHRDVVNQVAWQPQGSLIVTASDDDTAIVWDTNENLPKMTLYHNGRVNRAVWNADGSQIVTASDDLTARVWDINTLLPSAQLEGQLEGHTGFVNQAVWSPDGTRIVTASEDGTARIYYVSIEEMLIAACQRSVRNLTQAEWDLFMRGEAYQETCLGKPRLSELPDQE